MPRFFWLLLLVLPSVALAGDPSPANSVVVIDGNGKEITLKGWRFAAGLRKLGWLSAQGATTEALAFRETNSTSYRDGVVTLIPIHQIDEISFDYTKKSVAVKVAGVAAPLEGSIRFKEINAIVIEAEIDKGAAGILEVKYRGGPGGTIRGIRFSGAKAADPAKGDVRNIVIADGNQQTVDTVTNLKALYRFADGSEQLHSTLMFRKTFKLDLATVKHLKAVDGNGKDVVFDATMADGSQQSLTLVPAMTIDGKPATLEGLLGTVPAGFKIYPLHTVGELATEPIKAAPKKGDPKKDDDP
jgi:hypothetical protein